MNGKDIELKTGEDILVFPGDQLTLDNDVFQISFAVKKNINLDKSKKMKRERDEFREMARLSDY